MALDEELLDFTCYKIRTNHICSLYGRESLDRLQRAGVCLREEHGPMGAPEVMSSDDERRFDELCERASNEMDPERRKELISEILAVLEANQRRLGERGAASSDDKAS
jgi:hypothetical protein